MSNVIDDMTRALENKSSSIIDDIIACDKNRECIALKLKQLPQPSKTKGKSKSKRPPSAYNQFIGKCIKKRANGQAVSERMKECATEWKKNKSS